MKTKTYGDYTDYPSIFNKTYWGAFQGEPEKDIIENRNQFIVDWEIEKKYKLPKYMLRKWGHLVDYNSNLIDHVEVYKTRNNTCVIVNSPYSIIPASKEEIEIIKLGYLKTYPLYNDMALSYIVELELSK